MADLYVLITWHSSIMEGKGVLANSENEAWEKFYTLDPTIKKHDTDDDLTLEQFKNHALFEVRKITMIPNN